MRYHFSCFHNCFSEIVQNLSKSATFGMGSCNFQIKNVLLFQMGNNFHMIKKLFCTSLVYLRRSINHGRLFFIEAANSLRPLLVFMVFVIEGRNHLKFWTEAKVKFGRRFEVELKRLLRSESSSPKMIFNQSSSVS